MTLAYEVGQMHQFQTAAGEYYGPCTDATEAARRMRAREALQQTVRNGVVEAREQIYPDAVSVASTSLPASYEILVDV